MQEHILQPFVPLAGTGQYRNLGQVFKNWDPFVNEALSLTTALATPRATGAGSRTAARSLRSILTTARFERWRRSRRTRRRSTSVACASARSTPPVSPRARRRR
jgi:hypothetical protein